jgi:hypothetical protein
MKPIHALAVSVWGLCTSLSLNAQNLGTDYITFGSFEGYGDNNGQINTGSFAPQFTVAFNDQGFTSTTGNCWEQPRWPDIVRYYWRYYQSAPNANGNNASNNVTGRLIHRLNDGNTGMENPWNGDSWQPDFIWNNQYLRMTFNGPAVPNHMALYQELRSQAPIGQYQFTMQFKFRSVDSDTLDPGPMRVQVYGVNDGRLLCNEVPGAMVAGNLLADFNNITIDYWYELAAVINLAAPISSILIRVSSADGNAPVPATGIYFDDIHFFSTDCTPRWTEPQFVRNTYGSVSTGDICALLAEAIAQDGSPDHLMINQLRILCGMDDCPPPCNPACPMDLDGSGTVDAADITILESLIGMQASDIANPCWIGADINEDGIVGVADLLEFLAAVGMVCDGQGLIQATKRSDATTSESKQVYLVPNPTEGVFKISAPFTSDEIRSVSILDATGRVVLQQTPTKGEFTTIDLSAQQAGVYLVLIRNGEDVRSLRLIKE